MIDRRILAAALAAFILTVAAVAALSEGTDADSATGISLDRTSVTIRAGDDVTLVATVTPSGCGDTVTWKSSNSLFVKVDQNGTLTPKAYGSAKITASVGGYSAVCDVTIDYAPMEISSQSVSFVIGGSETVSVTVPDGYQSSRVVWRTSDSSVAAVSGSGTSASIRGAGIGEATITAICGNLFKATCLVTITEKPQTIDTYTFFLKMDMDANLADVGDSGLTVEDLETGFTLTATGYNAGAALESALNAANIPCSFWSGSSGSQALLYWVNNILGLGDVHLANGDWKYWVQYMDVGGRYVYNDLTLGYYTGGGSFRIVYTTTSDPSSQGIASVPSPASGLVYSGKAQTGVPSGEGYSISGNTATDAGSYTATLTLNSGYIWTDGTSGTKTVSWSIAKAALTAAYSGETIIEGSSPSYPVSVAGFVNGENASTAASYVAPKITNSDLSVGSHVLTPSGGSAKNYSFQYVSGILTVTAMSVAQIPSAANLTYSGETQTGVPSGTGYSVSGNTATDAGSYVATLSLNQNYKWSDGTTSAKTISWSISKAVLTAKYAGETIIEGSSPSYQVSVTGFVNGETASTAASYVAPKITNSDLSVGSHVLTPAGGSAKNYSFQYVSGTLTVTAMSVAQIPSAASLVYNGKSQIGVPSGAGYSISGNSATDVGSYKATLTLSQNYKWSDGTTSAKTISWSISKAVLKATYNGETIIEGSIPAYAVSVTGFVNGENASAAASYVAPKITNSDLSVGSHVLTPSGGSAKNYSFQYVSGTLTVTAMSVAQIPSAASLTYSGKTQTGVPSGTGYSITGNTATDVGSYKATLTLSQNYKWSDGTTGTKTISWSISKAVLTAKYADETIIEGSTPSYVVSVTGFVNGETASTAASYVAPKISNSDLSIGNHPLTPAGGSAKNYSFQYVAGTLTVTEKSIAQIPSAASLTYNGKSQTGVPSGAGYSITGNTATDVGSYKATLTLSQNYKWSDGTTGTKTISWSISKAVLTAKYAGETIIEGSSPAYKVAVTGFVNGETASTAASYVAPKVTNSDLSIGSHVLTPAGGSAKNYSFQYVAGTLTVTEKSIAQIPSAASLTYNGKSQTGVPSGEGYTIKGNTATDVGSYKATLTLSQNCKWSDGTTGTKTISWSISKAVLTARYNGESVLEGSSPAYAVSVTGFVNGETASTAASYVAPKIYNSDLSVGSHVLTPSGGSAKNYSFQYVSGTLTVTEKSIAQIPSATDLTYTGKAQTGVPSGEGYTIKGNTAADAGSYVATLTLKQGYKWSDGSTDSKAITWSVSKAVLIAKYVNETITEGSSPAYKVAVIGFVNGETASTAADYVAPKVSNSDLSVGSHTLLPSGGSAKNYSFKYNYGVLNVTAMGVAQIPSAIGLEYSGVPQTGVPSGAGYSISGNTATDVGSYVATLTLKQGYKWSDGTTGTRTVGWSVSKAVLTASYLSETITEGSSPAYNVAVTGFVNGETASTAADYVAPKVSNSDISVGSRVLTPAGGSAKNYSFQYVSGTLTVSSVPTASVPSPIDGLRYNGKAQTGVPSGEGYTIKGNSATDAGSYKATLTLSQGYKWSDGTTGTKTVSWSISKAVLTARYAGETIIEGSSPAYKVAVTGFVNGETASTAASYVAPKISNSDLSIGDHSLKPSGGSAKNYSFQYVSGILTVTEKSVVPIPAAETLTYSGKSQTGVPSGAGYSITGNTATDVGSYKATLTLSQNYKWSDGTTGTKTVSWSISKAVLTARYSGETIVEGSSPAYAVSVTGFVNGETASTAASYVAPKISNSDLSVGSHVLTPAGGSAKNYSFKYVSGTLTVAAKSVAQIPSAASLTYSGKAQTGVPSGTGYTVKGNVATDAGSYVATLTLSQGYKWSDGTTGTKTVSWSISKATLTARYAGETITEGSSPVYAVSVTGFVNGETASTAASYVAPKVSNSDLSVGSHVLVPSGGSAKNYTFRYASGTLTVLEDQREACVGDRLTVSGLIYEITSLEPAAASLVGYEGTPSKVTIPSSVAYCGKSFSVTAVGTKAFYSCASLSYLDLGSVETVALKAFANCAALKTLKVPAVTKKIGGYAFFGCGIVSLDIPGDDVTIETSAFSACTKMRDITFSGHGATIGTNAFYKNNGVRSVDLSTVASVGYKAFPYCNGMETLTIPGSLASIGAYAFFQCANLRELIVEEGVKTISKSAFSGCKAIECISFPATLKYVGDNAFYGLRFADADGNSIAASAGNLRGNFFSKFGSVLTLVPGGEADSFSAGGIDYLVTSPGYVSVTGYEGAVSAIPAKVSYGGRTYSVAAIGDSAFLRCTTLASADLSNVKDLGFKALGNCTKITQITFGDGLASVGSYALYGLTFYDGAAKLSAAPDNLRGHTFAGSGGKLYLVS